MFEPYRTTYGSLITIDKTKQELTKYLTTADINALEYEYPTNGDVRSVYITGYDEAERDLPSFEHPMLITLLSGVRVVVSDMRRYLTHTDVQEARLVDITKDKNSVDFNIIRALLITDFINGNIGQHRSVFAPSTTAMGVWLSGMIGTTVLLDPLESFAVEICASYYANTLYYPVGAAEENKDAIAARVLNSKHAYTISRKAVKEITDQYNFDHTSKLNELVDNLGIVLPEEKAQFVTVDSIIAAMGNVWFGPGGSETPIMALENMPTWLALVYSSITNRSYKKSRIGTLLNKHARTIDSKKVAQHFDNYLEEIKVK